MMKRAISIAVALLIMAMAVGGLSCIGSTVNGSGNLTAETHDFTDFTSLEGQSGFELEVTAASTFSVEVTADDNVHQYIEVEQVGETLALRLRGNRFYGSLTLRAKITMPELYKLELSGGSRADIDGFSSTHTFVADLSGGSQINGDLVAGDITMYLSGGSQVNLEGAGEDLFIDASGGSHLDLENFPITNAAIYMSGGSRATINISGTLDVDLSGGSRVEYVGTPTLGDLEMSGESKVERKH
jgi:hypothetical protein